MKSQNRLTEEEMERYRRQVILPDFGPEGQLKLLNSKVLVIGAGGLGSPVLLYLAAAGVGTIGVIDGDVVDRTNLQRQVIHMTSDISRPKVESARERMLALNPNLNVATHAMFLTQENASEVISQYDFAIDATDSFDAKFLINDTCVALRKPYNHGAIYQYQGQTMTIVPGSACYRCLFDSMPEKGDVIGPLGVVPGILGTIQATEAIKYITGIGQLLTNRLLTFDCLSMQFNTFSVLRRQDCRCNLSI